MLSTQYRLRLEAICEKIVAQESVGLEDMMAQINKDKET